MFSKYYHISRFCNIREIDRLRNSFHNQFCHFSNLSNAGHDDQVPIAANKIVLHPQY
jgi:hypothetical protein